MPKPSIPVMIVAAILLAGGTVALPAQAAKKQTKHGKRGARGPQGPPGPQGPAGLPGITEVRYADGPVVELPPGGVAAAAADCPTGLIAVGGGFDATDPAVRVVFSRSLVTGWRVIAVNDGPRGASVQASAVCIGGRGMVVGPA